MSENIKYEPCSKVHIVGREFVVLSACGPLRRLVPTEPQGTTVFLGTLSPNNYHASELEKAVAVWQSELTRELDEVYGVDRTLRLSDFKVSTQTLDNAADYGKVHCDAAPLSLEQYRSFRKFLPEFKDPCWLITGAGAPGNRWSACAMTFDRYGLSVEAVGKECGVLPSIIVPISLFDEEQEKQVDEDREGICPVCGAVLTEYGLRETMDDGGVIPWTCLNCGATGDEGYNHVFDGHHYNVCDGDGKPIEGR